MSCHSTTIIVPGHQVGIEGQFQDHAPPVEPEAGATVASPIKVRGLRNVALLEMLVSTGARIGEVVGLNVGDLLDDQAAYLRSALNHLYPLAWPATRCGG